MPFSPINNRSPFLPPASAQRLVHLRQHRGLVREDVADVGPERRGQERVHLLVGEGEDERVVEPQVEPLPDERRLERHRHARLVHLAARVAALAVDRHGRAVVEARVGELDPVLVHEPALHGVRVDAQGAPVLARVARQRVEQTLRLARVRVVRERAGADRLDVLREVEPVAPRPLARGEEADVVDRRRGLQVRGVGDVLPLR